MKKIFEFSINNLSGIYIIKSTLNGKSYVGSAVNLNRRYSTHLCQLSKNYHPCKYLQNHCNKYGIDDLIFNILEFCDKEKLIEREQFYIDTLKPIIPNGFNTRIKAESSLGCKQKPESIRKAVETRKRNGVIPFANVDRSKYKKENHPNFGKNLSKETRLKISKANMGRKISEENKLKTSIRMQGFKHSNQAILKLKEKLLGNKNAYGIVFTQSRRDKISAKKSIKINQLTMLGVFIKTWPSAKNAGFNLGINYKNINSVVNGKRNYAGKFKWQKYI